MGRVKTTFHYLFSFIDSALRCVELMKLQRKLKGDHVSAGRISFFPSFHCQYWGNRILTFQTKTNRDPNEENRLAESEKSRIEKENLNRYFVNFTKNTINIKIVTHKDRTAAAAAAERARRRRGEILHLYARDWIAGCVRFSFQF